MTRPVVTVLAELRDPLRQQSPMGTAMDLVTTLTILLDGGMLPDIGAALVGVTLEAQFPGIIGFDQTFIETAVRGMTGRTTDLALEERMMRPFIGIDPDFPVTVETHFRFSGLLSAADMEVMTGIAGYVVALMGAQIP